MVFIRKKNINGKDYGYLVKNKWIKGRGSRQKARYLGKIIKLDFFEGNEKTLAEFVEERTSHSLAYLIKTRKKGEIVDKLIEYELEKIGFNKQYVMVKVEGDEKIKKKREEVLSNGEYYYKARSLWKITTGKEAIAEINEGFLCRYSAAKLLCSKIKGHDEREKGIKLAKLLLEAGLNVEREVFVKLFEKWCE